MPSPFRRCAPLLLVGASSLIVACGNGDLASTAPVTKPSLSFVPNTPKLQIVPASQVAPTSDERFVLCKSFSGGAAGYAYPSASFLVHSVDGGNASNTADFSLSLQDGQCADFGPVFGAAGATLTVTETAIPGYATSWKTETFTKNVGPQTTNGSGLSATADAYGTRAGQPGGVGSRIDFTNALIPGAVGDFVWNDLNANGIQDAGEPGISGVTVSLTQGAVTTTTATDANGLYAFTGLVPGAYTVTVTAPAGYTASPSHVGGSATDSDAPSANVTVVAGQTDNTIDFGFYVPATGKIGDFVWIDANGNGRQDAGETGLAGAVVTLKSGATTLGTQTTGANGAYLFTSLSAGTYTVSVVAPSGYFATTANAAGSTLSNDSNANPSTVTLATNSSSDLTVDFGFVVPATGKIGDFVWIDANGNGRQDAGETGLAGAVVTLKQGSSTLATQTTGASGAYLFTSLAAGTYTVSVSAPSGYAATTTNAAFTTSSNDSNANPSTVTLPTNSSADLTIDFGYKKAASGHHGCTASYWKASQHQSKWHSYRPYHSVDGTFGISFHSRRRYWLGTVSLLDALDLDADNGADALIREGVAAVLNAMDNDDDFVFPYTPTQVIKMVRDAYQSGDQAKMDAVTAILSALNDKADD